MKIKTLTYFSTIMLAVLQTIASNASEVSVTIERAIVQTLLPFRVNPTYTDYSQQNNVYNSKGNSDLLEEFDASRMPVYLSGYEYGNTSITITQAPSFLEDETNKLLRPYLIIANNDRNYSFLPEAIYLKSTNNQWYLIKLAKK